MYKRYLFIVLFLIVACGGGEETAVSPTTFPTPTPTATSSPPDPTVTPSPQPTETAVPTPTTPPISLGAPYIDETYRYHIATLAGYQHQVNTNGNTVEFSPIDNPNQYTFQYQTAGGIIAQTEAEIWNIVQRLLAGEDLGEEINESFGTGTREAIQVAGADGISILTQFDVGGVMMMSKTAVIATEQQWFLLNSTMAASEWEAIGELTHDVLLGTVQLLPPLAEVENVNNALVAHPVGRYAIATLPGYEVEQSEYAAFFTPSSGDEDTAFLYLFTVGELDTLPEDRRTEFEQFLQGDSTWIGGEMIEHEPTELLGIPGVTSIVRTVEGGTERTWRLILVINDEQYLMFYGGIESSRWESEGQALVDTLVPTIEVYTPAVVTELTVSFGEPMISQSGGYEIASILNYDIEQDDEGFTAVYPPDSKQSNDFRYVLWGGLKETLSEEDKAFIETVISGENNWLGYEMYHIETIDLFGLSGITAEIHVTENGRPFKGRMIAVANEQQWLIFSGGIEASRWDNQEGQLIFEQLLDSLDVFPPSSQETP